MLLTHPKFDKYVGLLKSLTLNSVLGGMHEFLYQHCMHTNV